MKGIFIKYLIRFSINDKFFVIDFFEKTSKQSNNISKSIIDQTKLADVSTNTFETLSTSFLNAFTPQTEQSTMNRMISQQLKKMMNDAANKIAEKTIQKTITTIKQTSSSSKSAKSTKFQKTTNLFESTEKSDTKK